MDMQAISPVYRDTTVPLNRLPLEASTLITTPTGVRRPVRGAVTTAGVQRRRVIKKHIQQKYLLCGFAIHAFLATPAFLYGNVVESDKDLVLRIWPAIVYQATGQLCRSILEHLDTEYRGRASETTRFRREFLLATFITCSSLMISGVFFSSAWFIITTTTQAIAILFYGFFAGIGASLFVWRTHVILEAVRPREDKFVRKTIHLCGEAFCQLFLSFVFTSLRTLYGTGQSIVLMSALLVNLIPISLIITRHHEGALTKRISLLQTDAVSFTPLHHQLGRYTHAGFSEQIDMTLRELNMQRNWKNPILEHTNAAALMAAAAAVDSHTNYMLAADEAYVTFVNPNGVEIMEIIPEEDETISVLRSSTATIDNHGRISIGNSQNIMNKSLTNSLQQTTMSGNLVKIQQFSRTVTTHLWLNLLEKIAVPLKRALCVPKLYTTTFLMSTDIFSYVMCLTVLPGLAVSHHALKNAEIPFLFSLLAFPWMCFSLMTPRFGSSLSKHKIQWHILGCCCKALALICISFSTSKLLLSVSSVLLGFGQSVTLFLQDLVFQLSMPRAQWTAIRTPIHFTNSILILFYGALAHWVVVRFSFQATVLLAGVLYTLGISVWHLIFVLVHNRD